MSNKKNSNIPVWLIVLAFIFFWPFGMILLFLYLGGTQLPVFAPKKAAPKARKPFKKAKTGRGMIIGGSVLAALGGISFLSEILSYGFNFPTDWFPLLGMTIGGLVLTGFGVSRSRFFRRQQLYLQAIGMQEAVYLSDLAGTAGVSEKQATDDVQKMLADHLLPTGYIDRATGRLVLSDKGIIHDPMRAEKEAEAARAREAEAAAHTRKQQPADPDADLLRQIQAINDAIPDEVMSAKIDRIWDITQKILSYQRENPQKAPQLRQFLNYYLPTTLRLLKTYARLDQQGVEGANITAAKSHIEGMMDKVVEGFEKQLDQLFQTDAMDIATDVEVLERMLEKDGLSGEDFGGLTL